uniref:Salivary lipocalin n=1 Tax=Triatoma matogrossensis TaxID=162370 RepID=E2J709_9HEMI
MKTIVAVISFGILTFTLAQYEKIPNCNPPEATKNLDTESFLKGKWYVTNAKQGSNSTVCREYRTKNKDGKQVLVGDGYYTFNGQKPYFKVRCKRQSPTELSYTCTQTMPGNKELKNQFQLQLTILHTDYTNSAVMYRCVQFPPELGSHFEDNILVLHRDPSITNDNDNAVRNALKSQGLQLNSLKSREGVVCPEPPPKIKE